MKKQQIFNKACVHLAQQKRSTWSIAGQCLYLSPEGLMCTVGCLMSPQQLESYGSYKGYVELLEAHARKAGDLVMADFLQSNQPLLESLQQDHDGDACDVVEMRDRLSSTARTFGLNAGAVAQVKEWNG